MVYKCSGSNIGLRQLKPSFRCFAHVGSLNYFFPTLFFNVNHITLLIFLVWDYQLLNVFFLCLVLSSSRFFHISVKLSKISFILANSSVCVCLCLCLFWIAHFIVLLYYTNNTFCVSFSFFFASLFPFFSIPFFFHFISFSTTRRGDNMSRCSYLQTKQKKIWVRTRYLNTFSFHKRLQKMLFKFWFI